MDSILTSVKKLLGIEPSDDHFDMDILMHINSVMMVLTQIGVGPKTGFFITGAEETWTSLLGTRNDLEGIKTFIYLKVRLMFDPPTISAVLDSMTKLVGELEWRLFVAVDPVTITSEVEEDI